MTDEKWIQEKADEIERIIKEWVSESGSRPVTRRRIIKLALQKGREEKQKEIDLLAFDIERLDTNPLYDIKQQARQEAFDKAIEIVEKEHIFQGNIEELRQCILRELKSERDKI